MDINQISLETNPREEVIGEEEVVHLVTLDIMEDRVDLAGILLVLWGSVFPTETTTDHLIDIVHLETTSGFQVTNVHFRAIMIM
jgi:hypothetical protein